MRRLLLPLLAGLLVAACGDATGPDPASPPPVAVELPSLEPEAGTAGTERYVPVLHRIFPHAVGHLARSGGEDAAGNVIQEARRLHEELAAAAASGDREAASRARGALDGFLAQVEVRVFGGRIVERVLSWSSDLMGQLARQLEAARASGQDVSRVAQAAQVARRHLDLAHQAAQQGNPVAALVHAAAAGDLLAHLHAGL